MEFITRSEFENILTYEVFNEVLSRVYNKAIETALTMTPELASQLIKTSLTIRKIKEKFFSDNPEFVKYPEITKKVVQDVDSQNPGDTYEQILTKATPLIKQKIVEATSIPLEQRTMSTKGIKL